ncbi:MAG: FAD:protein FMN transferase, partial [Oscillospiraceae bacterium]|nr:FAD:protein FMN transferase [Oscillospiraceae bacterium]
MKIFIAFLGTLALILGLISACNAGSGSTAVRTEFALGTFVTVRIDGMGTKAADAAFDAAFARLREIERIASATDPASELFRLNQTAYQSDTNVGAELFSLLKTGRFYAELTDGNFDITLGR